MVMFSQVSICLHRGRWFRSLPPPPPLPDRNQPLPTPRTPNRYPPVHLMAATPVGGSHPTGMHVCFQLEICPLFVRVVTEFYRPRLERRLSTFTKQLSELDDYATELRKIENTLRVLTSEEKTERTIMALRNYSVVLKSLANIKKKISELPEVMAVFKNMRTFEILAKIVFKG